MVTKSRSKTDLFKALGHPIRREILRLIARKGAVSYKELTKLEPKAGVLYHHLRLLGDLIYQDENRLYHLTEKGVKALEFLETFFMEPMERSIQKYITPRPFLELLEGRKIQVCLISIFIASAFMWHLQEDYIQLFIFIAPRAQRILPSAIVSIISWLVSSAVLTGVIRVIYQRYCSFLDMLVKTVPGFLIINVFPLTLFLVHNLLFETIIYFALQIFAMLFIISAVSVVGRINLRKAALAVISLHYVSIMFYIFYKAIL